MTEYTFTKLQGQYLAFIHTYTLIHGVPPSEGDMQAFFQRTPPSIHQMVVRLHEKGLIAREPGQARSIQVLVPPEQLPILRPRGVKPRGTPGTSKAPIYRIKITLEESDPPIWRRILVHGDITLARLDAVIQIAMGWTNSHLHQFIVDGDYYGVPDPDYASMGMEMRDERKVKLNQIAPEQGAAFRYEYDFGDSWLHTLIVEDIREPEAEQVYPRCVAGERACPPEDVGGLWGYEDYLEAVQDPDHPEHEDYVAWYSPFDPEAFDPAEVNADLRKWERTGQWW
jgi:hypothetical protein